MVAGESAITVATRLPLDDKGSLDTPEGGLDTPHTCTPPARSLSPSLSSGSGSDKRSRPGDEGHGGHEVATDAASSEGAPQGSEPDSAADADAVSVEGARPASEADCAESEGAKDLAASQDDKKDEAAEDGDEPADEEAREADSAAGLDAPAATGGARSSRAASGRSGREARRAGQAWDFCGGRGGGPAGTDPAPDARVHDFMPGPGGFSSHADSDRRIIEVLAAPEPMHRRLLQTARRVPEILSEVGEDAVVSSAELYGSLALDMSEPSSTARQGSQNWASYYVNGQSDVDFVVQMQKGVNPIAVAQRLINKGPWRMVGQVQVHKFASTQFTLLGQFDEEDGEGASTEVYLDITCIEQPMQFRRFKLRQEAFRKVFLETRANIEGQFGAKGALAFDAYIHLLKGFAAKIRGNALTGFQATCLGIFTLQSSYVRIKPTQSIALSLFEGFLRFVLSFYSDMPRNGMCWNTFNYCNYAIDLSYGGRWLPRQSSSWRSEMYFMGVEVKLQTRPDERMNVTHSLEPARVAAEALDLLNKAFSSPYDFAPRFPGH